MSIPQITHQIWLQGWDSIPDKFKVNVKSLEEVNPDFKHMKWDESSLRDECAKISPAVQEKFDSFKYLIQKVDLGRYVVLYNYGGISVDTDMLSFKTISKAPGFKENDFIISYSAFPANTIGWVNNALIMCKQYHPIILELILNITKTNLHENDFLTKELYIDATTSPSKFNEIVYKNRKDTLILDNKYFEPCFSVDIFCRPSRESIMDHKHELSWFHGNLKVLAQIIIILIYLLIFIFLPVLIFFISRWLLLKIYSRHVKRLLISILL